MCPKYWKLSQGANLFDVDELMSSIEERLVYVHKDTGAKGHSEKTQGQLFAEAAIGDYFYLTHGNSRIYLLGQFTGPVNFYNQYYCYDDIWMDRPFRLIARSHIKNPYNGIQKWWTPNHPSTFVEIPEKELALFEELILLPYFEFKIIDHPWI